jgi:hypothetical protein
MGSCNLILISPFGKKKSFLNGGRGIYKRRKKVLIKKYKGKDDQQLIYEVFFPCQREEQAAIS